MKLIKNLLYIFVLLSIISCAHNNPKKMSKQHLVEYISDYSLMRYVIPNYETIAMQCFQSQAGKLSDKTASQTLAEYKKLVLKHTIYQNSLQQIYDTIPREELEDYADFLQSNLWNKLLDRMKYADKKKNKDEFKKFRIDRSNNQETALIYYETSLAKHITSSYTKLLASRTGETKISKRITKWFNNNEYQFNIYWAHVSGFLVEDLDIKESQSLISHRQSKTHQKMIEIYKAETLKVYRNYLKLLETFVN